MEERDRTGQDGIEPDRPRLRGLPRRQKVARTAQEERYRALLQQFLVKLQGEDDQPQFAARIGECLGHTPDQARISAWVNARNIPSAITLFAMIEASGRTIEEFLGDQDPELTMGQMREEILRLHALVAELAEQIERKVWRVGGGDVYFGSRRRPADEAESPDR